MFSITITHAQGAHPHQETRDDDELDGVSLHESSTNPFFESFFYDPMANAVEDQAIAHLCTLTRPVDGDASLNDSFVDTTADAADVADPLACTAFAELLGSDDDDESEKDTEACRTGTNGALSEGRGSPYGGAHPGPVYTNDFWDTIEIVKSPV